jgi:hypothetical protein
VLATISAGRVGSTGELAAALDLSPAMVEALVAELEQRGLLERVGECGDACGGCPVEPACGSAARGSAWMLTSSGRRYVAQ